MEPGEKNVSRKDGWDGNVQHINVSLLINCHAEAEADTGKREQQVCTYMAEPMNIDDDVPCATLSEDNCSVAFGTASGMVHIVAVNKDWLHMNMLRREKLFTAHQEPVLACAGDRQLLTSSADRMRLWCTRTGFCQKVFAHHGAMSVAFDPKGCYFASASNDNVARVWRVDPAEHFVSFFGHLARLEVCLFHPNGKYLATGSADATGRIWDCEKRTQMRLFRGHKAPITVMAYSVCGHYLVSGGRDDLIIVWDTTTERITCSLTQPNAKIASIDFSYCNNLLVVWSQDCHLSPWEFQLLVKCPEKKVSSTRGTKASELALISTIQACKNGIFLQSGFVGRDALIVIWTMSSRKVIELSPKAAEKKTALVKALETFTLNVEK
ncbi:transcription initiation factor TFIID subunit 5-like isoform X1 [Drosophila miranda]|uniref:transcription initiation factor TFIID subunit 5-like isoform X1 n=2 Tax=Drosophila miranda TaxID=7229 RepID=UPI00143F2026|nr:transcription initiation factor TFIID subunit 5-like isoform X1 [Drosophila miranda]XP_033249829.1 transcription initiation factor TFIID subunit 5-like isoform X1 [Drosophila miranda]